MKKLTLQHSGAYDYFVEIFFILSLVKTLQQPPSILITLILTKPSAIFLWADVIIRENVGREIFICLAASICFKPSKQASLIASNSSRLKYTPSNLFKGLQRGLKHRSPGIHFTQRVFLGRKMNSFDYEHMFITSLLHSAILSIKFF